MPLRSYFSVCILILVSMSAAVAGQPVPVAPSETRTGEFQLTFKERSPFSVKAEIDKRLAFFRGPEYDLAVESFEVYVPKDYKPNSTPYGLLAFINSGDDGKNWGKFKPLLDKYKLIWISANKAGNERAPLHRAGLTLDGIHNLKKMYNIDPDRVYLSGISGGGRCASGLAPAYPDVFNGAIYLIGCNPWQSAGKVPPQFVDKQKRLNSYSLITGSKDYNKPGTLEVEKAYKQSKYERVQYLEVPDMGHDMPPTEWLEKGLVYLDEPLALMAGQMLKAAQAADKSERFGQALPLYRKTAARGTGDTAKTAAARVAELEQKRDEILANAKKLIDEKKGKEAIPTLEKMLRQYDAEAGNVRELLREARK